MEDPGLEDFSEAVAEVHLNPEIQIHLRDGEDQGLIYLLSKLLAGFQLVHLPAEVKEVYLKDTLLTVEVAEEVMVEEQQLLEELIPEEVVEVDIIMDLEEQEAQA